jgi:hypothetical protein
MHESRQDHAHPVDDRRVAWRQPWVIALAMVALVLTFYLLREHWNHLASRWIYLLLLACPLLHLLMHGGHGGHRAGDNVDAVTPPRQ